MLCRLLRSCLSGPHVELPCEPATQRCASKGMIGFVPLRCEPGTTLTATSSRRSWLVQGGASSMVCFHVQARIEAFANSSILRVCFA